MDLTKKKRSGRLGKLAIDMLDLSTRKHMTADLKGERKETWMYIRPAWLIAVRKKMIEFYSD